MSKKFIWLSAIALVFTLAQPSFACSGDTKQCNAHHRFDKLAKELDLSADQKAKINAYRDKAKATFKEYYTQFRALRSQINTIVKADTIDQAKLDSLIEKVNKIRGPMLKSRIIMQHQMYALLNEKQKAKFLELKKKWHEHNSL
ncbi:MAG: Spy/CpxP family protein refolding chaperone [Legionella sp.]